MTQTLSVRMDSEVKKEFVAWCNAVGMNASTAVNMFAKKVLQERKLPFEVSSGDEDEYYDEKDDPFYSESNMKFLQESIREIEEGKVITKTMEELKAMENA